MSMLPTKSKTIQDQVFLKQKSHALNDTFPLDLKHIQKEQKSVKQLKKIDKKKLGTKEVRGVEVKTCLENCMCPKTAEKF